MKPRIPELIAEMRALCAESVTDAGRNQTKQTPLFAELLTILAEEQAECAAKMERLTAHLVNQTDRLVAFTKGLYVLTVVLLLLGVVQLICSFRHP